jgi:AraC family transcriptional regulator
MRSSAHEIAQMMPQWWKDTSAISLNSLHPGGLAATRTMSAVSGEKVFAPPSDVDLVCFIMSGDDKHSFWLDGKLRRQGHVNTGLINIIPAGTSPMSAIGSSIKVLHILLPRAFIAEQAERSELPGSASLELRHVMLEKDLQGEALSHRILAAMVQADPLSRLEMDAMGLNVAAYLLRMHSNLATPKLRHAQGGLGTYHLRRICQYIMDHLCDDVSLAELAAVAGLSAFHFARAFKQSTGIPPYAWMTARRMERAQEMMLAQPAMGLTEIALCVGYESHSAFSTAFRQATGATPSQWRKAMTLPSGLGSA